jgi:hypothetical protein
LEEVGAHYFFNRVRVYSGLFVNKKPAVFYSAGGGHSLAVAGKLQIQMIRFYYEIG